MLYTEPHVCKTEPHVRKTEPHVCKTEPHVCKIIDTNNLDRQPIGSARLTMQTVWEGRQFRKLDTH